MMYSFVISIKIMLNYKTSAMKTSKAFILLHAVFYCFQKKSDDFKSISFLSFLVPVLVGAISTRWTH